MTIEELEAIVGKLAQMQVDAMRLHEPQMDTLRNAQIESEHKIGKLADAQANTQAALDGLITTVDRFIGGRPNGRR